VTRSTKNCVHSGAYDIGALDREKLLGGVARDLGVGEDFAAQPGDVEPAHLPPMDERGDDRPALIDREGHWFGHIPPPPDSPVLPDEFC